MSRRSVAMTLHPVQRHVDFAYFEASDPLLPDGERSDGYYFPKRDWVEMDCPSKIIVTVGDHAENHDENTMQKVHDAIRSSTLVNPQNVDELIGQIQNAGILFRER